MYKTSDIRYSENPYQALRDNYNDSEIFQEMYPEIVFGRVTSSPLREDNTPSWIISDRYGRVSYKDFGNETSGDIFEFVKEYEGLANTYAAFEYVLAFVEKKDIKVDRVQRPPAPPVKIGVKYRPFKTIDKNYWEKIFISSKDLERYNVRPISHVFVNDYCFQADPLAYAYHEYKDDVLTFKIYQPLSEEHKWMNNHDSSVWQGWNQLNNKYSESLILTKSLKDIIFIDSNTTYCSTGLQAEGVLPKKHVISDLCKHYPRKLLLYDNDVRGVQYSQKFMDYIGDELGFTSHFINVRKGKDITEMAENVGLENTQKFLKKIVDG